MGSEQETTELLFFDTFSHESSEDLNLDLVQFPQPVLIHEVRVVPLGTRVTADFPGGVRLGATTPSAFKLELFVNNLRRPNASTFEKLGLLDYKQNVDIQLIAENKVPTDGLILKGWYTTVTVAVYGTMTTVVREKERSSPPPPAPPPTHSRSKPQAILPGSSGEQQHMDMFPQGSHSPQPLQAVSADSGKEALWSGEDQRFTMSKDHMVGGDVQRETQEDGSRQEAPHSHSLDSRSGTHESHSRDYSRGGDESVSRETEERDSRLSTREFPDDSLSRERERKERGMGSSRESVSRSRSRSRDRDYASSSKEHIHDYEQSSRDYKESSSGSGKESKERGERGDRDWQGRDRDRDRERTGSKGDRDRERDYRDHRDRDSWDTRDSRESRDYRDRDRDYYDSYRDRSTRERSSRESRDYKDKDKDRDRDRDSYRDSSRDTSRDQRDTWDRDWDRESDKGKERDQRDKDKDRDRDNRDTRDREELSARKELDRRSRSPDHPLSPGMQRGSRQPPANQPPRSRSRSKEREREKDDKKFDMDFMAMQEKAHGDEKRDVNDRERELVEVPIIDEEETEPGEIPEENPTTTVDIYEGIPDEPQTDDGMDKIYDNLSDGEIQEADVDAYSEISSDENLLASWNDAEIQERMGEWSLEDMEEWTIGLTNFNPDQCDLAPMETFNDPGMTVYEIARQKLILTKPEDLTMPSEATEILNIVSTYQKEPHREKWIEAMDRVPGLVVPGLVYIVNKTDNKDVLEKLIEWTFEGLDLSLAMAQPITAYKVRHLKMGIKMAATLCSCDSYLAFGMLSRDVQLALLELYTSPSMSSSVKLQIIKALDSTTRLRDGLDWFLGKHHLQQIGKGSAPHSSHRQNTSVAAHGVENGINGSVELADKAEEEWQLPKVTTAYQKMMDVFTEKQMVRSSIALVALVRKVHCYTILCKLSTTVESIAENTPAITEPCKPSASSANNESDDGEEGEVAMETEPDTAMLVDAISMDDIEATISSLEEATTLLVHAEELIAQPRRCLPNKVQFSCRQKPFDPYPNLYHMFSACRLLESVFVLLSSPATCNHIGIFTAVKDLLNQLISMQSGLVYLSAKTDTVNGILRTLTQNNDYNGEEGQGEQPTNQLGLKMIYYLQTLQNIDQLKEYFSKGDRDVTVDDAVVLGVLYNLYSMTFTAQGREAVVHVMTLEDNLTVLLPFVEEDGESEEECRLNRSVVHSYAILLLLLVVRHSSRVSWLETYGTRILACCDVESAPSKLVEKISELQDWLQPLNKVPVFEHDQAVIAQLVTQLKTYNEEITTLPQGLVTTLRILAHLAIDPFPEKQQDSISELKYKYVLIELFSADCVSVFTNMLQKVGDLCLRPWQQGVPSGGIQATVVMAMLKPILELMKGIQSYLILARGPEFKDLTALPCLFNLHTVMCSVSNTGTLPAHIQEIQNQIVDVLLTYTQPGLSQEESEEALSQNLWTLMIKEVFKYSLTAPYTFLSGLVLLSEMLPLPLPIQTRTALSEPEVRDAVNTRKLWSGYLHPIIEDMQEIVRTMSGTSCQPLQQLLRRVCWQLADLAAPTALSVVKCLLDITLESMDSTIERHREDMIYDRQRRGLPIDENVKDEARASGQTSRILNLLAFLMNQAPIKSAFLHLTKSTAKGDEKYGETLGRFVTLLNVVSDKVSHSQAQMSIVALFQSLCDMMVTMATGENSMSFTEQLANSLPPKEQLSPICIGLLEHINNREHKFSSILPSLRTLALLMDHDYGFYHVKEALEKVPRAFFQLFMQINATFSKDSSDCIATLSSAAECLQFLVALPEPAEGSEEQQPPTGIDRTYTISWLEVRDMLGWTPDMVAHPLDDLDKLLQEYAKEEETLKAVHESINAVVTIVKADVENEKSDLKEPLLPAPESLSAQFAMRAKYMISDEEDERLSSIYWLSTPMAEESDQEIERIPCDLDEMNRKYCPDYDLMTELDKGAIPSDALIAVKPRRRIRSSRRSNDTINTSRMRGSNRGFIAPMRGRGFGRGIPTGRNDLFRSRPPNTSRPPSMHVDDFIKMENQGQAPTMPTGMNPQLRNRSDKEPSGRGRGGFDRGGGRGGGGGGFNNRGRFFSPPGNYGRRDQGGATQGRGGRGGYGGLGGSGRGLLAGPSPQGGFNAARGTPGMQGRPDMWQDRTPQQRNYGSRGFGVGNNDNRQASGGRMDRRQQGMMGGGGGNRFSPHGGTRGHGGRPGEWQQGMRNKEQDNRFMPQQRQGGGGFRGGGGRGFRDRGSHRRTFTK